MAAELGGFVTSVKSFIGAHRKIDQEGLFSEVIFGPTHNFCCACGFYNSKALYSNQICPKCNVMCGSNDLRYDIFGKIEMMFPIIKPSKRSQFLKIIGEKNRTLINPIRADANSSLSKYIIMKSDQSEISIIGSMADCPSNKLLFPFRITGIYSLYLVLKFIKDYLNCPPVNEIFDNEYMTHVIKVLPPNLRMVTYDDSKKEVRTPEINKCYTSILNLNKSMLVLKENLKVDEEDWIEKLRIALKDKIFDQDIVEPTVIENDAKTAQFQYWANEIYRMVYTELSGKNGLIRSSILGKNIEFSARTVITVDPSLPPYKIKVAKNILRRLWAPYFVHYLTIVKQLDESYVFENLLLKENENELVIKKLFDEFLLWFKDNH